LPERQRAKPRRIAQIKIYSLFVVFGLLGIAATGTTQKPPADVKPRRCP
jgi:hypothetical protein